MTTTRWIIILLTILVIMGIVAYSSYSITLYKNQKYIEEEVKKRIKEIEKTYEDEKRILQNQINIKQSEIIAKNNLIKEKDRKIKESEARIAQLQKLNDELIEKLKNIKTPATPDETRKRLKELGYELCF